ncbi:MAG: hypothetical protein EBQ87_03710, partial [Planctomycetes bacterium]|nr:hypothetical protein [Planctomycetota bacterium]
MVLLKINLLFKKASSLALLTLMVGCNSWPGLRDRDTARTAPGETPTSQQLVAYLNNNGQRVQAIQCNQVSIDAKQGNQTAPGLDGLMVCQKPRNFRLKAKVIGQPAVDIGSNNQEFWYWISKVEPVPYVFHCNYDELEKGNVRLPFPFHPDMIVSALGMGEYDPSKQYEVKVSQQNVELVEPVANYQGKQVRKSTVFLRKALSQGKYQVAGHILRDVQGREICNATVYEVQQSKETGAILPQRIKIIWPEEKMEMVLRLNDMQVTTVTPDRAERLFSRGDLSNL